MYKRQELAERGGDRDERNLEIEPDADGGEGIEHVVPPRHCLLYTSDAADERSRVDLGGRRIIKKKQ